MTKIGQGHLVISGMMRSGTTLLQRALDAHSRVNVAYQSHTEAFIAIKKRFLDSLGKQPYHVLAHYNGDTGYKFSDFQGWLEQQSWPNLMAELLPEPVDLEPPRGWLGLKEVLIEEFYPTLLSHDVYCLNIVRDPRDVIASMSFGNGQQHTGKPRPVLFDLRNWRKSAHFAYGLRDHKAFRNIRFEDLLVDHIGVLTDLFSWLGVDTTQAADIEGIMMRSKWPGNSSFGTKKAFDSQAMNNYTDRLPEPVIDYIEATCFAEMKHLGYPVKIAESDRASIIGSYKDPFAVSRGEFDPDYSSLAANVEYEIDRLGRDLSAINSDLIA